MSKTPQVHLVMGPEETLVIGTALNFLIQDLNEGITEVVEHKGCGKGALMQMLGMKLTAVAMYREIWTTLGVPAEEVEAKLAALELDEEE